MEYVLLPFVDASPCVPAKDVTEPIFVGRWCFIEDMRFTCRNRFVTVWCQT